MNCTIIIEADQFCIADISIGDGRGEAAVGAVFVPAHTALSLTKQGKW